MVSVCTMSSFLSKDRRLVYSYSWNYVPLSFNVIRVARLVGRKSLR